MSHLEHNIFNLSIVCNCLALRGLEQIPADMRWAVGEHPWWVTSSSQGWHVEINNQYLNLHVFGLWKEAGVPGMGENMQTHKREALPQLGIDPRT